MDDLERAILYSFAQSTDANSQLRTSAQSFCDQAKQTSGIWRICMEKFLNSQFSEVQFWCLQVLDETIRANYSKLNEEELKVLRHFLLSPFSRVNQSDSVNSSRENSNDAFKNTQQVEAHQIFVRNKLAQVIVRLISVEYPERWQSVFLDLINYQLKGSELVIDMVCRVFSTLDNEIISLEYPRTHDEITVAVRIKDAMRLQCMNQMIDSWYQIIMSHQNSPTELASFVLEVLHGYITWIDIGLIANDKWISLFMNILLTIASTQRIRFAVVECLLAIVNKKMDPLSKVSLLQKLQITRVCSGLIRRGDAEFIEKLSNLFTGFAVELLECYKKFDSVGFSEVTGAGEAKTVTQMMLDEVIHPVLFLLENADEEEHSSSSSSIQFILSYVGCMKDAALTETQTQQLNKILTTLFVKMQYSSEFISSLEEPDKAGREEEERMFEYRKELYSLLRSITRLSPSITYSFIHSTLSSTLSKPDSRFEQLESILSLIYQLGENLLDESTKHGNGILGEFVGLILSSKSVHDSHRVICLLKMEICTRYLKFLQHNPDYFPAALVLFLENCGLFHNNPSVSARACYLFSRIVKQLKHYLFPFLDDILQRLHGYVLAMIENLHMVREKNLKSDGNADDRLYCFEAIGNLIGLEDLPSEKACSYLSLFLSPLCNKIDTILQNGFSLENTEVIWSLNQIIVAISYLSKGFGEQVAIKRPKISELFQEALSHVLKILQIFPKNQILRSKVISFLHRMLDIMGDSVFSFILLPLQQLMPECEAKDMCEYFQLLNQLMNKFKTSSSPLIAQMLPPVTSKLSTLIPSDLSSFQFTNTEEVREVREVQKAYALFLQTICFNDLLDVFLMYDNQSCFTFAIKLLVDVSSTSPDMTQRKNAVQVFTRLVKDWIDSQPEKIPGLKKFVIENFFPATCLQPLLRFDFDLKDANSYSFFGETVTCQKFICEKCGDDFFVFLNGVIFPSLPCTTEIAQQYFLHLKNSDVKDLKNFLKTFVQGVRTSLQNSNGAMS